MIPKHVSPTMFVMAGGTGGHILPGLAVAHSLQEQGWTIVWLGNKQGMEYELVTAKGIAFVSLEFSALRGKGLMSLLSLPWRLIKAVLRARKAFTQYSPKVVLGMGGYVAFPGGLMARLAGVPLVLHEQNSIPGMTNKVLAKLASNVLTGFPNVLNGYYVGNPVRQSILMMARPAERYQQRTGALRILVVGGSLGAQALNTIVPQALSLLPHDKRPVVVHQSGAKQLASLVENYKTAQVEAQCVGFIDDMASAYADADLVICRAGAMTVAEISCAGVAALFVPYPHAVDDHQTYNARFLSQHSAAQQIAQSDLNASYLSTYLLSLTRDDLLKMASDAQSFAKYDATQRIADVCQQLAKEGKYHAT